MKFSVIVPSYNQDKYIGATLNNLRQLKELANQLQGAELAAANLAAQMSASAANVAASEASNSGAGSTVLSFGNTSSYSQALQASASGTGTGPISGPGPILDPNLPEGAQVASPANVALAQNQPTLITNSQSLGNGSISEASQHNAANEPAQSQAARSAAPVRVVASRPVRCGQAEQATPKAGLSGLGV